MPLSDFIIYVYCCVAAAILIMKNICFAIAYKMSNRANLRPKLINLVPKLLPSIGCLNQRL